MVRNFLDVCQDCNFKKYKLLMHVFATDAAETLCGNAKI